MTEQTQHQLSPEVLSLPAFELFGLYADEGLYDVDDDDESGLDLDELGDLDDEDYGDHTP